MIKQQSQLILLCITITHSHIRHLSHNIVGSTHTTTTINNESYRYSATTQVANNEIVIDDLVSGAANIKSALLLQDKYHQRMQFGSDDKIESKHASSLLPKIREQHAPKKMVIKLQRV